MQGACALLESCVLRQLEQRLRCWLGMRGLESIGPESWLQHASRKPRPRAGREAFVDKRINGSLPSRVEERRQRSWLYSWLGIEIEVWLRVRLHIWLFEQRRRSWLYRWLPRQFEQRRRGGLHNGLLIELEERLRGWP